MATIPAKFMIRAGTAAQWTAANPVLDRGEMGWAWDAGVFKIGNGTAAWSALPQFLSGVTVTSTEINRLAGVTGNVQTALNNRVALTGDQEVSGVKTFTSDPVVRGLRFIPAASGDSSTISFLWPGGSTRARLLYSAFDFALVAELRESGAPENIAARVRLKQNGDIASEVGRFVAADGLKLTRSTQAEAEAGTNNDTTMTPLRVRQSISSATAQVLAATASMAGAGVVGSYAFLFRAAAVNFGDIVPGSELRASGLLRANDGVGIINNGGPFVQGSWRALGQSGAATGSVTLYIRIS